MTYQQLLDRLNKFTSEQLASNVTVRLNYSDEYVAIIGLWLAGEENDVLDEDHPYIVIDA